MALTPPDLAYVAAMEATLDADGIAAARAHLVRELAKKLRPALRVGRATASSCRLVCVVAGADRAAAASQRRAALSRRARRRGRARAGDRAVRRGRQHDRHDRSACRDQGQRCARAPRPVRALRSPLARRAAGARQVVRAGSDGAARRHAAIASRACSPIRASTRAIRIASARSSARSRCATSRASTPSTAAATASSPSRCSRSIRRTRSSPRRSPARSISGSASPSRAAREMKGGARAHREGADAFAGRGRDRFAHAGRIAVAGALFADVADVERTSANGRTWVCVRRAGNASP